MICIWSDLANIFPNRNKHTVKGSTLLKAIKFVFNTTINIVKVTNENAVALGKTSIKSLHTKSQSYLVLLAVVTITFYICSPVPVKACKYQMLDYRWG